MPKNKTVVIPKFWTKDRLRTLEKFALLPVSNLANMFNISFTEFRKHIAKSKEAYHILQNARNYTLYQAIEDLKTNSQSGCYQSARLLLSLYGSGDDPESLDEQLGSNQLSPEEVKANIRTLLQNNPELLPSSDNE